MAPSTSLRYNICDDCYRNNILDAFITLHVRTRWLTFCSVVKVIYEDPPEGSQVREILADMHALLVVDDAKKFSLVLLDSMRKEGVRCRCSGERSGAEVKRSQ